MFRPRQQDSLFITDFEFEILNRFFLFWTLALDTEDSKQFGSANQSWLFNYGAIYGWRLN